MPSNGKLQNYLQCSVLIVVNVPKSNLCFSRSYQQKGITRHKIVQGCKVSLSFLACDRDHLINLVSWKPQAMLWTSGFQKLWVGFTNALKMRFARSIFLLDFCVCTLVLRHLGSVLLKSTLITKFQGKLQEVCGKIRSNPVSVLQYVKSGINIIGELKFYIILSYV